MAYKMSQVKLYNPEVDHDHQPCQILIAVSGPDHVAICATIRDLYEQMCVNGFPIQGIAFDASRNTVTEVVRPRWDEIK